MHFKWILKLVIRIRLPSACFGWSKICCDQKQNLLTGMALSQSWNGNWTSPAIRITSYSGNEINILNPSFIFYYYWNIFRIHSTLMIFFIQNQKAQFLFDIRIFSIFRCRFPVFHRFEGIDCTWALDFYIRSALIWTMARQMFGTSKKAKSRCATVIRNGWSINSPIFWNHQNIAARIGHATSSIAFLSSTLKINNCSNRVLATT